MKMMIIQKYDLEIILDLLLGILSYFKEKSEVICLNGYEFIHHFYIIAIVKCNYMSIQNYSRLG